MNQSTSALELFEPVRLIKRIADDYRHQCSVPL